MSTIVLFNVVRWWEIETLIIFLNKYSPIKAGVKHTRIAGTRKASLQILTITVLLVIFLIYIELFIKMIYSICLPPFSSLQNIFQFKKKSSKNNFKFQKFFCINNK